MPIFQKRTDNSKKKTCQGFQNFTFQFIYAQRSKKCMMVCNSKLCKNRMYYAPLYAAICNYSKRLHLYHVNPFLKLKLFLQKYFRSSKFRAVHREKIKEVYFFKNGNNYENVYFLTFPACFSVPIIFSNLNSNCSNLFDLRNLQEQI